MLLQLPPELLSIISDEVVQSIGIRASAFLRLVCREFDQHMIRAICNLPTFEDLEDDSPPHLTYDVFMDKTMVARLIHSKIYSHSSERPLIRQLCRTAHFVREKFGQDEVWPYLCALICLTAGDLPLDQIIRGLRRDPSSPFPDSDLAESVLVAAYSLDRPADIEILLTAGAKGRKRTMWFGDALVVAAQTTRTSDFTTLIQIALDIKDSATRDLVTSRIVLALFSAAWCGSSNVFCEDLLMSMRCCFADRPASFLMRLFGPALKAAMLHSHEDISRAIFRLFQDEERPLLDVLGKEFSENVLRLSASNGSRDMVQLILENIGRTRVSFALPLEDASRTRHAGIAAMILESESRRTREIVAGSIYWAARGAHYEMLTLLFGKLARPGVICVVDALSGAFPNGPLALSRVIAVVARWFPTMKSLQLDGNSFSDIFEDTIQAISQSEKRPEGLKGRRTPTLRRAVQQGDLPTIVRLVRWLKPKVKHVSSNKERAQLSEGFSSCIDHKRPGILLYLHANFPNRWSRNHWYSSTRSTAIFQIMIDCGWDFKLEVDRSGLHESLLMGVVEDEELTRWCLKHGADPNFRYGLPHREEFVKTPLSVALGRGSLSTVYLLLQHGGDLRLGKALAHAIETTHGGPEHLALVDLLVASGASLTARTSANDSHTWLATRALGVGYPLHFAHRRGSPHQQPTLAERNGFWLRSQDS